MYQQRREALAEHVHEATDAYTPQVKQSLDFVRRQYATPMEQPPVRTAQQYRQPMTEQTPNSSFVISPAVQQLRSRSEMLSPALSYTDQRENTSGRCQQQSYPYVVRRVLSADKNAPADCQNNASDGRSVSPVSKMKMTSDFDQTHQTSFDRSKTTEGPQAFSSLTPPPSKPPVRDDVATLQPANQAGTNFSVIRLAQGVRVRPVSNERPSEDVAVRTDRSPPSFAPPVTYRQIDSTNDRPVNAAVPKVGSQASWRHEDKNSSGDGSIHWNAEQYNTQPDAAQPPPYRQQQYNTQPDAAQPPPYRQQQYNTQPDAAQPLPYRQQQNSTQPDAAQPLPYRQQQYNTQPDAAQPLPYRQQAPSFQLPVAPKSTWSPELSVLDKPSPAAAAQHTNITVANLVQAMKRAQLDEALVAIVTFLKAQYANSNDEEAMPVTTMDPEDILALSQCFHAEVSRIVEQLKAGPPRSAATDHRQLTPSSEAARFGSSFPDSEEDSPLRKPRAAVNAEVRPPAPYMKRSVPSPISHASPGGADDQELKQTEPMKSSSLGLPPKVPVASAGRPQTLNPAAVTPAAAFAPRVSRSRTSSPMKSRGASAEPSAADTTMSRSQSPVTLSSIMPKLYAGSTMVKYGRNGSPQLRFFRVIQKHTALSPREPFLVWAKNVNAPPTGELPLLSLLEVTSGATTKNFKRNASRVVIGLRGEPIPMQQCFTLTFTERTVDIYAPGAEDYTTWFTGMKLILARNRELEAEGAQLERAR